jgi:hypothetical protein
MRSFEKKPKRHNVTYIQDISVAGPKLLFRLQIRLLESFHSGSGASSDFSFEGYLFAQLLKLEVDFS